MSQNFVEIAQQTIARLRQLVRVEAQHSWHDVTLLNIVSLSSSLAKIDLEQCPTVTVNDKGYIVFPQGRKPIWLAQKIIIPSSLRGYPVLGLNLRLALTWWAEVAEVFIDGRLVQQGDLFDSSARVLISDRARSGAEYIVTIKLISPHHDIGALMRSHLIFEADTPQLDPGLVADELAVLLQYTSQFAPERLDVLAAELDRFDWSNLENAEFGSDLAQLRSRLLPLAESMKQRCFHLLGHAHLDMAWLWTTDETYRVAERTFKSVFDLQRDFPTLTFGHTSPALYQWLELNRPGLFQQIKTAVVENKWELLGGMWIEPETNLVSGESLIRQLLYGQEYYQKKFGKICTVAWLPDSFGFTWQLPQIMQQCGIEYFVTGKLHWNDTTEFPLGCFWWESPDGTRLLTLISPPNVTGVMDTNPITMSDYAIAWERQTGLQDMFWLPGVGDHGGGPTRDMLEVASKWETSPFFPRLEFSTAKAYLDRLCASSNLPVWQDELYLELHRGCYTVHADQKQSNRRCERLLYEAELWATIATLLCQDGFDIQPLFSNISTLLGKTDLCQEQPPWQQLIEIAWKKVLFNQFHDILPGTSIPEVFVEANRDWETAEAIAQNIFKIATDTIASSIELPQTPQPNALPVVVFNSLNWERSQEVTIEDERLTNSNLEFWCEESGKISTEVKRENNKISFWAKNVPGIGYRLYWLCWEERGKSREIAVKRSTNYELDNEHLKVVINPQTGNIDSIIDRQERREILSAPGNQLQLFEDRGQYWDAWNIDPEYEQKPLSEPELVSIEWIEAGIERGIRVIKKYNNSTFIQDYILETNSPLLKIANKVVWQETQVMVKVAFPLNLKSDRVTYEIPCGTISRTTTPQTAAERAKWEVSALNWADLTDNEQQYGVSLLNDCKYGYDAKPNQLRLTLLRSPLWPDPQSDRGVHHFTYALYPHQHDWKQARTVRKAYELNTPLRAITITQPQHEILKIPPTNELLNLSADNLILMALKISTERKIVLRCYEAHGEEVKLNLQGDLNLKLDRSINCLEITDNTTPKINALIKPYKIHTYAISKLLDRNN